MPLGDLVKPAHKSNYDESVAKDMPIFPGASLAAHVVLKNIQVLHHVLYSQVLVHLPESLSSLFTSAAIYVQFGSWNDLAAGTL